MKMDSNKNIVLRSLAPVVAGIIVSGCVKEAEKPNIIFFLVDDMGWMDSTPYGSRYYETPNIERLAARGKLFTCAYSASPLSSPTRASIMTGRSPERFHLTTPAGHLPPNPDKPLLKDKAEGWKKMIDATTRTFMPLEEVTVAERLKEAGYKTCHIGKWHLGHEPYWAIHQGFDEVIASGHHPGPPSFFAPYGIAGLQNAPDKEYLTDRITDEALGFIERNRDSLFYLNLWHYAVHAPYQGQLALINTYKNRTDPRGKQNSPIMGAMIEAMDRSLGRILDKLDELGLSDNTIIIFTSDNGGNEYDILPTGYPTNNDPLRDGKGNIHEGGVRIPCIISWPGVTAPGSKSDDVISTYDYHPTLLRIAGLEPLPSVELDGESIVPLLSGKGKLNRNAIFTHFPHYVIATNNLPSTSVRTKEWKLIRVYGEGEDRTSFHELYRIEDDLSETRNVAQDYPDVVRELDRLIEDHIRKTGATVPVINPAYDPETVSPMGTQNKFPAERIYAY
jgi:arylsulfatase A-like enzyme